MTKIKRTLIFSAAIALASAIASYFIVRDLGDDSAFLKEHFKLLWFSSFPRKSPEHKRVSEITLPKLQEVA